jgi:alpha-L-fucosidase
MDKLWGDSVIKLRAENAERGQLFNEGNYAMFIHWGLYSQLANKVDDKTYYGIGEWIMNPRMAGIPVAQYKNLASTFNPEKFDAPGIAKLAKDAGMKYIVITAKHHDGFAMYDSKASDFNVVDATPWNKDPMKELSAACRAEGLGFGFYYSHNQDWTFPGGGRGPKVDEAGNEATFDDYFEKKCLPQVKEITTEYGPIEIVWFDTPGKMPKHYVEQLVEIVHKNQPRALVSGRAGHDLGDYQTLGDMEVPHHNIEGMWESVDTTNDSWAYAWYDEYWKSPREILKRLLGCVGRGGTYMLNIGPDGKGVVPERAAKTLRKSGQWIHRYPQVVYGIHRLRRGSMHFHGETSPEKTTRCFSACSIGRPPENCICQT